MTCLVGLKWCRGGKWFHIKSGLLSMWAWPSPHVRSVKWDLLPFKNIANGPISVSADLIVHLQVHINIFKQHFHTVRSKTKEEIITVMQKLSDYFWNHPHPLTIFLSSNIVAHAANQSSIPQRKKRKMRLL